MKNRRLDKCTAAFLILPLLISLMAAGGCATAGNTSGSTQQSKVGEAVSDNKESLIGAGLIGALGTGVGYALGGASGAAIGGGAGAAIGALGGQVVKQQDKKRTEAVSEAGNRPEQAEGEAIARTGEEAESREEQPQSEGKRVAAVTGVTKAGFDPASRQANEMSNSDGIYDIVRNGKVIGSVRLDGIGGRSIALCQASALSSCGRPELDLRRH